MDLQKLQRLTMQQAMELGHEEFMQRKDLKFGPMILQGANGKMEIVYASEKTKAYLQALTKK